MCFYLSALPRMGILRNVGFRMANGVAIATRGTRRLKIKITCLPAAWEDGINRASELWAALGKLSKTSMKEGECGLQLHQIINYGHDLISLSFLCIDTTFPPRRAKRCDLLGWLQIYGCCNQCAECTSSTPRIGDSLLTTSVLVTWWHRYSVACIAILYSTWMSNEH